MKPGALLLSLATLVLFSSNGARADEIRVAVASNFKGAMAQLAARFEILSGHDLVLSYGSSGKQYAQIVHGAPFDVFFAADSARPAELENAGLAVAGSRFTYAVGRLALWSRDPGRAEPGERALAGHGYRHLAIANPKLAPYGRAARETLISMDLWDAVEGKLVMGENIGQTFQFVNSGNAELGLVAWSQILQGGGKPTGSSWLVPQQLHRAIEQQVVLLSDKASARQFMEFVRSHEAVEIIRSHGYGVPDAH